MKKRMTGTAALLLSAALLLTGCGGSSQTTEEAQAGSAEAAVQYGFADGKYTCKTFSMDVPEGWVMDETYEDVDSAMFCRCDDVEDYDQYGDASIRVSVTEMSYGTPDSDYVGDYTENDKQFFVDEAPTISEASLGEYSGNKLEGQCSAFKDQTLLYLVLNRWEDGTNNESQVHIACAYPDEESKEEIDAMINSMVFTADSGTAADEGEEAAGSEDTAQAEAGASQTIDCVTVTAPEGWVVDSETASGYKYASTESDSATIEVNVNEIKNSKTAEEWADALSDNFGGGHEVKTYTVGSHEFVGIEPVSGQFYIFCDSADGEYVVKISGMHYTFDQAQEFLECVSFE